MTELAVTCYLTKLPDPQRGERWPADSDDVVRRWCESIGETGMRGLILHDHTPREFRERWGGPVEWRRVEWRTRWSTNDERFVQYLELVLERDDIDWWLFTDLSDVEFFRDPFRAMLDDQALYIQTEPNHMGINTWMQAHWIASYGKRWANDDEPVYNAGMFGGHRQVVEPFIDSVVAELRDIHARWSSPEHRNVVEKLWAKHGCNGNMSALNKAARRWLREAHEAWERGRGGGDMPAVGAVAAQHPHIVTGRPLHTEFKAFEGRESGCYVRHK